MLRNTTRVPQFSKHVLKSPTEEREISVYSFQSSMSIVTYYIVIRVRIRKVHKL